MTCVKHRLIKLKASAQELGASDAKIISTKIIPIENEIIDFCKDPLCESYGKSFYCPPYAMNPQKTKALISDYDDALIFKINVSTKILLSQARFNEFRRIFEITAHLELFAIEIGFSRSRGFAAGSCKPVFCPEYQCQALVNGKTCRYSDKARPSMEAVGINVFKLVSRIGWEIKKITESSDPEVLRKGILVGLVLVG
jgi:predicted metal-binding protein